METIQTGGPRAASDLARNAAKSADVIFACGGDGTVHEVMQGLVCESGEPSSALGIIPLGSANALARYVRLSLDPVTAALQQVHGTASTISVGKVCHDNGTRYFVTMAGAGPDGALVDAMRTHHKSRMGRLAYGLHAAQVFFTRRLRPFEVAYTPAGSTTDTRKKAVSVMAVRVSSLGGIFAGLTSREASPEDATLRLHILSPPSWISLPFWFLFGWLRLARLNPFLRIVEASSFKCLPLGASPPHAQVDGEWLGCAPFEASVVPYALRLLRPAP